MITESKIHSPCKFFESQNKQSIFIESFGSGLYYQKRKKTSNFNLQLSDWLFNFDLVWLADKPCGEYIVIFKEVTIGHTLYEFGF